MEGFNKLLALFAALFVTIIVGFLIVRKYNLQKYPLFGGSGNQPSPTMVIAGGSQLIQKTDTAQAIKDKFAQTKNKSTDKNVKAIPETGASALFAPLSLGLFYSGLKLRKKV